MILPLKFRFVAYHKMPLLLNCSFQADWLQTWCEFSISHSFLSPSKSAEFVGVASCWLCHIFSRPFPDARCCIARLCSDSRIIYLPGIRRIFRRFWIWWSVDIFGFSYVQKLLVLSCWLCCHDWLCWLTHGIVQILPNYTEPWISPFHELQHDGKQGIKRQHRVTLLTAPSTLLSTSPTLGTRYCHSPPPRSRFCHGARDINRALQLHSMSHMSWKPRTKPWCASARTRHPHCF